MKPEVGSAEISRQAPPIQPLVIQQKIKLKRLVEEFPYFSFYFDDLDLKENAVGLLEKIGFTVDHIDMKARGDIIKLSIQALEKGHLIALHYQKRQDGSNILSLFTELKRLKPHKSFKNIIPVFVANVVSGTDNIIFKALSKFDIRFSIFLNPDNSCAPKLEDFLNELQTFQKLIFGDIRLKGAGKPDISRVDTKSVEVVERYKSLVKKGDELMKTNPKKAIELFSEAIDLKPDFYIYEKRGDAYYLICEFTMAINDYIEANKLSQGMSDPFAKISACCFNLVRQEAKKGSKDIARKWFDRGMKSFHKAEKIIEKIEKDEKLSVEGYSAGAHKNIMEALAEADLRETGMREEEQEINSLSRKVFEKIKHIDFSDEDIDVDTRMNYAITLTRQKHYEIAEKIFRSLIRQNVDNAGPALNNFAVELRKNKEYEKAFNIYRELFKYKITNKDVVIQEMMTTGRKYALTTRADGKAKRAVKLYEEIVRYAKDAKNMERVFCDMAAAYLEIRDTQQALTFFNMAVEKNKNQAEPATL
ncbi:hypothetical protein MNBD_NITROSPINAE03-1931 [hydrothermal vent metagenome]|uniref:Tetratricopeptide repeat protein n=1 Tax=hydrothermal vent metagenome TaxID=652676 RepID=A0A3B1CCG7_9ZZZZ